MAKVTIDEVEYDPDTFNEEQTKLLQEIIFNKNLSSNLGYQVDSLNIVSEIITNKLRESLKDLNILPVEDA